MRFAAGHDLELLHIGTRMLGALVRLGFIGSLGDHVEGLLRIAFCSTASDQAQRLSHDPHRHRP
jgi:hypothetical protein